MIQTLLYLSFSAIALTGLVIATYFKKVNFKSMVGLFLFGVILSIPFIMVEYMGGQLKYYLVILTFIAIELAILGLEKKIKYLHDLVHHNVKELRITSFILIGLGFTYSEISFTILHSHGPINELIHILPFKITYSLLAHTVLASAASLINVGNFFSESIFETIFKLVSYYTRIAVISLSHYLYLFSIQNNLLLLITGVLVASLVAFFYFKKHLDKKHLALKATT